MRLICKTRQNTSPQGKPRVYYTGHPKDLGVYATTIFQDILEIENCAIYYDGEPEAPYNREELFSHLEQMQLFVILVTGRFLREPNRAREIELDFAVKRCHIPVLPLMPEPEPGLEAEFNEKCGNLQILVKESILGREKALAGTVLSYREKLARYLTSVLIGDDLAAKVRAASLTSFKRRLIPRDMLAERRMAVFREVSSTLRIWSSERPVVQSTTGSFLSPQ